MSYLDRILFYCKRLNISQSSFERAAGLSKGQITKWKKGANPGLRSQLKVADFMSISVAELMSSSPYQDVALIDPLSENDLHISDNQIGSIKMLPDAVSDPDNCYAVKICDDSMNPYIYEGDIVIADKDSPPKSGDIAAVFIPGSPVTCRKILHYGSGIILQPCNVEYDARFYTSSELSSLGITVSGRIISHIHHF